MVPQTASECPQLGCQVFAALARKIRNGSITTYSIGSVTARAGHHEIRRRRDLRAGARHGVACPTIERLVGMIALRAGVAGGS